MNEIQKQLDDAFAKSLFDMSEKRESGKKDLYKTGVCVKCCKRFDIKELVRPYWYNSRAKLCPGCLTRVSSKR